MPTSTERPAHLLVADDEESIRWVLERACTQRGHAVTAVASGTEALAALRTQAFDVALVDIRMPDVSGLDVLTRAREERIDTLFIVMTAQNTMANAIEATKRGAYDYLTKPFDLEQVALLIDRALELRRLTRDLERLRGELEERRELLIGRTPAMQEIYKVIGRVAPTDATVLIQGETGTGKELVARTIHHHSDRRGPFVALNCSAIPNELLESELFGYERGAFTGAVERRIGKFEAAAGGTLFLDEIADMPLALQAKVLRVLQEREFTRVGGREAIRADVRIVAATNQDLEAAVRAGRFREDLFFRLHVVRIHVPPLRERRADIPELIDFFIDKINRELGTSIVGVTDDVRERLIQHPWPGNVRELENTLRRAAVLARGRTLVAEDFALIGHGRPAGADAQPLEAAVRERLAQLLADDHERPAGDLYARLISAVERPLLELVLERAGGNQVKAAQMLGINRNTLRKKITDLGIPLRLPGLYAIVDPLDTGRDPVALARALLAGGAELLQVRLKGASAARLLAVATEVVALGHAAGALVLVNDRPDVARAAGADGVHLGQDDLPVAAARRVLGPGALVGVSTHDVGQARAAAAAGADYLGVGPVFATTSKTAALPPRGLDLVRAVRAAVACPLVAIGGITAATAAAVRAAGAD